MERKGFVVFYLNINNPDTIKVDDFIDLVRRQNSPIIAKLASEGYDSMFVPCFNEACRVERIDIIGKEVA